MSMHVVETKPPYITKDPILRTLVAREQLNPSDIPEGIEQFPHAVRYLTALVTHVWPFVHGHAMNIVYTSKRRGLDGDVDACGFELYKRAVDLAKQNAEQIAKRMKGLEGRKDRGAVREHRVLGLILGEYMGALDEHDPDPAKEFAQYKPRRGGGEEAR